MVRKLPCNLLRCIDGLKVYTVSIGVAFSTTRKKMFSKVIWSSFISNVLVRPLCWSDKYKECTYGSIQTAALAQNVENEGL